MFQRIARIVALAAVLLSVGAAARAQGFGFGAPFPEKDGEAIYKGICQGCHMPDGKGATGAGTYPSLAGNQKLGVADYPISLVIGGRKAMPSFGTMLDDEQIANVVNYIRIHFGNSFTEDPATPAEVAQDRPPKEVIMKPKAVKKACRFSVFSLCLLAGASSAPVVAHAADAGIVRTDIAPQVPIAAAVTVPPGYTTYYISGALADAANPDAPAGSAERWGNTETQTLSILSKAKKTLAGLGLTFGDVVQAHVYLAADPKTGKLDFAGLNKAWSTEFGTAAQPNKPARAAVQVAALVAPGALVEIEFVAAKKAQ